MYTTGEIKTLCSIILLCAGFSIRTYGRTPTSAVYLNSPDSSVHTFVIENPGTFTAKPDRSYHWYSKNMIHQSDGGYSGKLLHGSYESFYSNNNLKSKGKFDHGLKNGTWICWSVNGHVRERVHYNKGVLDGMQELYDSTGFLLTRIYYRKNRRAGKTKIFSREKADSVVRYKKGAAIPTNNKKQPVNGKKIQIKKQDSIRDSTDQKHRSKEKNRSPEKSKQQNNPPKPQKTDTTHHTPLLKQLLHFRIKKKKTANES